MGCWTVDANEDTISDGRPSWILGTAIEATLRNETNSEFWTFEAIFKNESTNLVGWKWPQSLENSFNIWFTRFLGRRHVRYMVGCCGLKRQWRCLKVQKRYDESSCRFQQPSRTRDAQFLEFFSKIRVGSRNSSNHHNPRQFGSFAKGASSTAHTCMRFVICVQVVLMK